MLAACMATENPFPEDRDESERQVFWLERVPTIFLPFVFFFYPHFFYLVYIISIPILIITNLTFLLICINDCIIRDAASPRHDHDHQQRFVGKGRDSATKMFSRPAMSPAGSQVELVAFWVERVGAAAVVFSTISNDPLGERTGFFWITCAAILFTLANLMYSGYAFCRMFNMISPQQESIEAQKKEVASKEKKFGSPEDLMNNANGGDNTIKAAKIDQVPIVTNLDDRIYQDLKKTDMIERTEIKKDDHNMPDLVEVEDSQANGRSLLEDAETAEDERNKNINSKETVELDNFEILNLQCDEYTKKIMEAMEENYKNKLEKKNKNWEKQLKHVAEKYEEDRQKWENENKNLASQLCAVAAKYEFYHTLHFNHEENRLKWEDEKNDLITKLSFATASFDLYKSLLHDLFSNSE